MKELASGMRKDTGKAVENLILIGKYTIVEKFTCSLVEVRQCLMKN